MVVDEFSDVKHYSRITSINYPIDVTSNWLWAKMLPQAFRAKAPKAPKNSGLMDRMEDRWRKRTDGEQ